MLSLRCRINANVAELLVIIGYSELGPTLGARPFALRRSLGRLPAPVRLLPPDSPPVHPEFASSPVWSFPRLPRCRGSHWRASRWTAPIHSLRCEPLAAPLSIRTIRTAIRDQLEQILSCLCSIGNAYLTYNV